MCRADWEQKCEHRFLLISLSKVYQFMSSRDQNDNRLILHILSITFHQRKCFVLCYFCLLSSTKVACHSDSAPTCHYRPGLMAGCSSSSCVACTTRGA